jgi:hypothetical protein
MAIESEWFAPHFEFRFPLYGAVEHAAPPSSCARLWNRGT